MESTMEKYLAEIQFLRKQVSGEKLAHENTLKQLQSAYLLLEDIKDALRQEQTDHANLKAQLSQAALSLTATTQQYQIQINDIKELLSTKDEELRRINAYLRVNDVDIIRMKVVNQLQLQHAQRIEKIQAELAKKGAQATQLRNSQALLQEKYQLLLRQRQEQQRQAQQRNQQVAQKHMDQLKTVHAQLQRERTEKHKWAKKHEGLQQRFNKQAEFYKEQIQQLNRQLESQNKCLLNNNQARLNKHKLDKSQEALSALKQQLAAEKESSAAQEQELTRLQKEIKSYKRIQQEITLDKERIQQEIEQLKKELAHREIQHKKTIEMIQREAEDKIDHPREDFSKIQRLEAQISRTTYRLQQLQEENRSLREQASDKHTAALKRQLAQKHEETQALKEELRILKKQVRQQERRQGDRKRTVSMQEKQGTHFKAKLQEANDKILQLLKEKIDLKQQISTLRSK